jgi:iron complex outermembrane recepter protein
MSASQTVHITTKNMRLTFTFILSALLTAISFAQQSNKVTGIIKSQDGKAYSNATVELLAHDDSSLLKLAASDSNGQFVFENLSDGSYLVSISAVGHARFYSNSFNLSASNSYTDLKTITLQPVSTSLKGVTVTAKKPFIEQKIDRTIINVESSISNTGSNALEVLEKSPGITLDKDGNISLKGRQGVLVMIDGKPSYLSGENLTNYLRGLPATALDQIEIMTNPPARYDASGNSGVINIKTKKNKQKGFNGTATLSYTQGKYWRTSNSANLNYRNNKWNLFANVNQWRWTGFNDLFVSRNFLEAGTGNIKTSFSQNAYFKMLYPGVKFKTGADFAPNAKTNVGITITGQTEKGIDDNTNTSYIRDHAGQLTAIIDAQNTIKPINKNLGFNFNFRRQFDTTGRELTADADYLYYDFSTLSLFNNYFYDHHWVKNNEDEIIKGDLPSVVRISSIKTDYTHPINKNAKIEAGVKLSHVTTNNEARYYLVENGIDIVDTNRSNHFKYKENIAAAYLNYNRQLKNWGLQLGLRAEYTTAHGRQYSNDSTITPEYLNLFPTVYVSFSPVNKHQFAASFGRRIERPAYQDLNPFRYFLDPYTYQQGNPYLNPQFSYNYQLSHTYNNILTTTLNYSKTTDIITETFDQVDVDTITYVYRDNISSLYNFGISVSANLKLAKWWNANVYTNVFHNKYEGEIRNKPLSVEMTAVLLNLNNQFTFGNGWSAELGGFVRSKGIEGQILIFPMGQLNLGVQKQVLNNKGTVKLSASDVLYTMPFTADFEFDTMDIHIDQSRQSRTIGFSFTYRFGKASFKSRQLKSGAEEEQNRVKKSGGN